ncbi:AAA family ATPase [Catellatospora tritici]|uniref:AAA family ATPase n=1 Tax=Catellatospora tritici TaxID=2851566 RepID=UPI001C2CCA9B|nr:ATP-binding protein [Catellatospora tritici]MBV1851581.1 ATP-binding protein [Catellatospora tritici]
MRERPTLYVLIGLPGAGKTTRARELEREHAALRLTPDEWMIPLFGEPEADGRRDVLEGRFIWLAMRALRLGANVILDFGVWSKDERSALRHLAGQAGADCVLVYLPIDPAEQLARVESRQATDPGSTFPITPEDLDEYRRLFQAPDRAELAGERVEPPPAGCADWAAWASARWPTSFA